MIDRLRQIVRRAGKIARTQGGKLTRGDISSKGEVDLVTRVDREIETFLRDALAREFPGIAFIGEEGDYADASDRDRVFIADPLDGTTSFVHGHPFYSISLAYREEGEALAGVVYLPYFDEIYYAQKDRGAFWNGSPITVSDTSQLIEALAGTGFACVRARKDPDNLPLFNDIVYRLRGIRRCGSAAIDLCYVAQGRYDLFWEYNLQSWDIAAGVLIVREAGGVVTDLAGSPEFEANKHLVASNGTVHDQFLEIARSHVS